MNEDTPASIEDVLRARVKTELRKRMRGLRKSTPASVIAAKSELIVNLLTEIKAVDLARGVALFWPIAERHEIDLRALDAWLRAKGKQLAYPSINPETRNMVFRWVSNVAELEERGLGFFEPPCSAPLAKEGLDAIVVPSLAIDPSGARLGYGAGFYDRALRALRDHEGWSAVVTIGVAFDFQYVSELPVLPHDERVQLIVTESRCDNSVS